MLEVMYEIVPGQLDEVSSTCPSRSGRVMGHGAGPCAPVRASVGQRQSRMSRPATGECAGVRALLTDVSNRPRASRVRDANFSCRDLEGRLALYCPARTRQGLPRVNIIE